MPAVNPKVLKWARETAGLSLEDAAQKVGIKDIRSQTSVERLAAIEAGEYEPSRPILLNMAKQYRRSLVVFYLNAPPEKGDRGEDFRRAPGAPPLDNDAVVDALIRDIRSRQSLIRALLEEQDAKPIPFIDSAGMEAGTAVLTSSIMNILSFERGEFRNKRSVEGAFSYLRSCLERNGVFVLLAGDLGSYHTDISPEQFRGYAIADPIAPLIVINDNDAVSAWSFTALHEATHLWLGSTGVSGAPGVNNQIERFCDDVAGEILLPRTDLNELASSNQGSFEEMVNQVTNFARNFNVSRAMVAYNLFRANIIGEVKWRRLKNQFYEDWQKSRNQSREKRKDESQEGPSYYIVRRHRLGSALLGLVSRALSEGIITYTKAGKVLGVKPRNVAPLLGELSYQGDKL